MKQIPNLFTLLNLVFGCIAIVYTMQNGIVIHEDGTGAQWIDMPERIWMASLFIGLAAVVDFLDGFVARLFKATSELGRQLDSLADVVSFGVAPGMILYQFLRLSYAQEQGALEVPVFILAFAFVLPAAAAWRLATFNLDTTQAFSFRGVPTPAVGLLVASFPLIYWNVTDVWVRDYFLLNKWVLLLTIVVLSWLMVSRIPILSLKFKDYTLAGNIPKLVILGIAIIAAIFLGWLSVPVIFLAYVLVSLLFKNQIA
ncbi:MAG: CDP-alcohol phosphatidyltransferase family protein [Chitinophagaceae bacterium]|nr:CDP-alcohol phosphatidyltransferase family protein [Chitinophagaceae bacterium]